MLDKKARLILQSGIYYLLTNISEVALSSWALAKQALSHIHVRDERTLPSPSRAGNIGALVDESLRMVPQVTAKCKLAFYHLRKIRLICKHLTFDAAQLLVQGSCYIKA